MKNISRRNIGGFTLVEILVVVLIIGILSAVAVPMYEKAVWKSRAVQLHTSLKSLVDAQNIYFMANGKYATTFGELDIGFDGWKSISSSSFGAVASNDAVRHDDIYELIINSNGNFITSFGLFRKGKFKGAGFTKSHKTDGFLKSNDYYCVEIESLIKEAGSFCHKIFATSDVPYSSNYGARKYKIN